MAACVASLQFNDLAKSTTARAVPSFSTIWQQNKHMSMSRGFDPVDIG